MAINPLKEKKKEWAFISELHYARQYSSYLWIFIAHSQF